jgi:hypothetical protein
MPFKNLFYFLLIAVFAITACSKSTTPKPAPTPDPTPTGPNLNQVWSTDADVYFVGTSQNTQKANVPTYWKNGIATILSSNAAKANGIAVNGNDVYIVGYTYASTGAVATLWKNGVPMELMSRSVESQANAIVINGSDVYIAGEVDAKAAYWKNGVATITPKDNLTEVTIGNSIAINGNDVYMVGYAIPVVGQFTKALYWKNGVAVNLLPASNTGSQAMSIALKDNDVYIAGYTNGQATIWKNDVATTLPGNSNVSTANSIVINGNDIYAAGLSGTAYTYWKNGVQNVLPYSQNALVQQCVIGLDGSDVYVAGGDAPGYSIYWRNNVAYQLSKTFASIYGMTVAPH